MDAMGAAAGRRSGWMRATHWLTLVAFGALLVSGVEIVFSHPRFYVGEIGNVNTKPLFVLPVASSRDTVPTRYNYVLPDQNGWSRSLHFEAAWLLLFTGAVYGLWGFGSGRFRREMIPDREERRWGALRVEIVRHLPWSGARADGDVGRYNALQKWTYCAVVFVAFPLMVWTGLAMSPAFVAVAPWAEAALGGRQTARTLHFALTWVLVGFVLVHVAMVARHGFVARMRGMITGRVDDVETRSCIR